MISEGGFPVTQFSEKACVSFIFIWKGSKQNRNEKQVDKIIGNIMSLIICWLLWMAYQRSKSVFLDRRMKMEIFVIFQKTIKGFIQMNRDYFTSNSWIHDCIYARTYACKEKDAFVFTSFISSIKNFIDE